MNKNNSKYVVLGLLILYVLGMMAGFLITFPSGLSSVNKYDKLIHFLEFLVLCILVLLALKSFKFKHHYVLGIILCLSLVILSEFLQSLIPSRNFSYYDMLADVFGIIIGAIFFKIFLAKY